MSQASEQDGTPLPGTDAEWKQRLTPEQYTILRRKGTETPFTGKYWHTKAKGVYRCTAAASRFSPRTPNLTRARDGPVSGQRTPPMP